MTTLLQDVLQGSQRPRLVSYPQGISSAGQDAVDFAAMAGLYLDPWQQFSLECLMQERADGKWAARTGVLICPRQNGKGAVDEAWELAQLFLNGCRIVLHTAHHNKTAKSAFAKMRARIEGCDELKSLLMDDRSNGIRVANGEYGFTFKSGQQLIYGTRTGGAGRGLTIDATVLDEAQELSDDELDALKPTMATAPNPQTLWTGSAPKATAEVLRRIMARGRDADPSLCYLEWSIDEELENPDLDDRELWAIANPGYRIRLDDDAIIDERGTMSDEGFGRERLGIVVVDKADGPFEKGTWKRAANADSVITGPVTFAVETAEDSSWACIGVAGKGPLGMHAESVAYQGGTDWIVARAKALATSHQHNGFVIQLGTPAASLLADFRAAGLKVVEASLGQYQQACGQLFNAVKSGTVHHLDQAELNVSVRGAKKKPSGDAFVWDRRKSLDISPLAAVTLAFWGANQAPRRGQFVSF